MIVSDNIFIKHIPKYGIAGSWEGVNTSAGLLGDLLEESTTFGAGRYIAIVHFKNRTMPSIGHG
jgi:hypothetical protein